ncbi:Hypothetical protein LUCI_0409 [Lucifera butyrica]|uniref:Uncharacterized protein n=1 Tax=Lucifera butyrica TaxID=1351585 RepID=A0A498R4K3_9FIRM|nr:hypothetical protein [Lucifera butyrica]VBB05202.1 Hypothetical protein LUCI_0409 [Lucifera butyrica]
MGYGCYKPCMPKCHRRCVGEMIEKYRVYETCCYNVVKVCQRCGCEYEHRFHPVCPRCGGMDMYDDPDM